MPPTAEEKRHASRIVRKLKAAYPDAHCSLDFSNPLELLIATILSAQCTDERVNLVTKPLFVRYRSARDYATAPLPELEKMIQSTGFFRSKAKNIQACCRTLVDEFDGEVPQKLEELVRLAGVGRKTANVVAGNAFGIATGVVVDTHVTRLSHRLGLSAANTAEKIERDLVELIPKKDWIQFSHWLIQHGRRVCTARKPKCEECFLLSDCPQIGVLQGKAATAETRRSVKAASRRAATRRR